MSKINNRVLHYLLTRQKRAAMHEIFERAVEAELLDCYLLGENEQGGTIWQLQENHLASFNGDKVHDRKLVQKALEASAHKNSHINNDKQFDELSYEFEGDGYEIEATSNFINTELPSKEKTSQAKKTKARKSSNTKLIGISLANTALTQMELHKADLPRADLPKVNLNARRDYILSIIASFAPSLKVNDVVTALLLAKAIGCDEKAFSQFLSIIKRRNPIISIRVPVHDFVKQLGQMLESGLVMPYYTSLESIIHGRTLTGHYNPLSDSKRRRSMSCLSGFLVRGMAEDELRDVVSKSVLTAFKPIIIADEKDRPLPARLASAADMMIEGDGIDAGLIADVLSICCQISFDSTLSLMKELKFAPTHLGVDDLTVAIRPGRSITQIVSILMRLENVNALNEDEQDDDRKPGQFGGSASSRNRKKYAGCFDVVKPQQKSVLSKLINEHSIGPIPGSKDKQLAPNKPAGYITHLFVETLAGYGKAQDWALDLKQDIEMWHDGEVEWSDLSSRLLLSGPPGTGKTTYARALCNTLQVPLIATSVARWLEPSHLGDVLSAISATFDYVSEHGPCILFIDEIDNVGNRNGGNKNDGDDYWASLINRLLELLDGASKTEGVVIIGATNRPEKIDAALLRSGRLEKHIMIPPPDTGALIGIIAHHLGDDLDAVLESNLDEVTSDTSPAADDLVQQNSNTGTSTIQRSEEPIPLDNVHTGAQAHE